MTGAASGTIERGSGSGLADVVETVLDKGVVIDAQVTVDVVGIRLLEINARIVIASIETYLRFAEAVDRLDVRPSESKGLPDIVEGVTGSASLGGAVGGAADAATGVLGSVGEAVGGAAGRAIAPKRDRSRQRTDRDEGD
ncbi:gas vesicle protein GvpJ [Plantactinospora siamensis]|uniref:gas vesicle protein GvpJ n=1 Tax=Plantactinospora siamensis TaxID=555372 RepID=UPI00406BB672